MRRILVINPNTSASVTERLRAIVAARAGTSAAVQAVTAGFGARYIADEASYAVAAHAALVAYAESRAALDGEAVPDVVLLGCFGDPGVQALREVSGRPVIGLAEAAMREAASRGRFAIVTGGAAWGPMLERLARGLALDGALERIEPVAATGAALAANPAFAHEVLTAACRRAALGVDAVILGGAGLAGVAQAIAPSLDVPLIDSVDSGARAVLGDLSAYRPSTEPATVAADWNAVSPALRRLGL